MKKFIIFILLLSTSIITLNSCASFFASGSQNLKFNKPNDGTKIYVNNQLVDKVNTEGQLTHKVKKSVEIQQITVTEKDYVNEYLVTSHYLASPWKYVSLIFFPTVVVPAYDFKVSPVRTFRYPTIPFSVPQEKVKKVIHKDSQKYLYLTQSSFDLPKKNISEGTINYRGYYRKKTNKIKYRNPDEDIKLDNTIFSDDMNNLLKEGRFVDTTGKILKNPLNTMYVKVVVESMKMTRIVNDLVPQFMEEYAYIVELGTKWEILDAYEQSKYTQNITIKSGEFAGKNLLAEFERVKNMSEEEKKKFETDFLKRNPRILAISHALEKSFHQLLAQPQVQSLLEYQKDDTQKSENLKITMPTKKIISLDNALEGNVTVITEKGHGSGFAISEDGYIITNFHVIVNNKDLKIQTNKGEKLTAKLVKKNEFADLALLKVEHKFDYAFAIPNEINFSTGQEIFAIGTPKNIEFGQTLTKGIISSKRKRDDQDIIQTDASVNQGNSGGALIDNKGNLIGIVNAKLMGVGVEGIAFAILAKDIIKYLNITY